MFEGRSVSLRQVAKNQYEYKTAHTLVRRTGQEIEALLNEERGVAQRLVMETSLAKQKLHEAMHADTSATPPPSRPSSPPPPAPIAEPSLPIAEPIAESPPPALRAAPKPRVPKKKSVTPKPAVVAAECEVAIEKVEVLSTPPANDVEPTMHMDLPRAPKRPQGRAYLVWLAQQRAS